jgi:putative transposase
MGQRITPFGLHEFYHTYNRGVDKRQIFLDKSDHTRFLLLMYLMNTPFQFKIGDFEDWKSPIMYTIKRGELLVGIGAYCLMPNHFHILLREVTEGGITKFMQKLSTAYTMYFNRKHERTGSLFEGKFKAEHADRDVYLKYLYSYIHLNPISILQPGWKIEGIRDIAQAKKFLDGYRSSSYLDYQGVTRPETAILSREEFPDYFGEGGVDEFAEEVSDWLSILSQEE